MIDIEIDTSKVLKHFEKLRNKVENKNNANFEIFVQELIAEERAKGNNYYADQLDNALNGIKHCQQ